MGQTSLKSPRMSAYHFNARMVATTPVNDDVDNNDVGDNDGGGNQCHLQGNLHWL